MAKEDTIVVYGTVLEICPNALFRVSIEDTEKVILAHLAGKMRIHNINIRIMDRVTIEMSPYDLTRGRIIFRSR